MHTGRARLLLRGLPRLRSGHEARCIRQRQCWCSLLDWRRRLRTHHGQCPCICQLVRQGSLPAVLHHEHADKFVLSLPKEADKVRPEMHEMDIASWIELSHETLSILCTSGSGSGAGSAAGSG